MNQVMVRSTRVGSMGGTLRHHLGALLLAGLVPALCHADDKPTRAEIGKRGKAATGMLINGKTSGSAFCVHPSGLFATNEHNVRNVPQGQKLKLVLDSGLPTQRVLDARVIRRDTDHDLALLRVEGGKDFPSLLIGRSDGVAELDELIAFGFPFGTNLSADRKDFPAISVNVATVSALRRKNRQLHRIDLNGAINPGQSGGPMLDADGKVVGVIVSGILGSGIAQAIPSSHLASFLEKPEIDFIPPRLNVASAGKPVTFQVRVDSLLPSEKQPEVELTLTGNGAPRRQKLELRDGMHTTTLVPVPVGKEPKLLELTARYAGGTVIISPVGDRVFKVANTSIALKDIKELRRGRFAGKGADVTRTDGSRTIGPVEGLEAVEVKIGGQAVTLDLLNAETVQIAQPGEPTELNVELVVTIGGKEVGRSSEVIPIAGATGAAPLVAGALKAPVLDADKIVKKLPGTFSDVALGGNGRYLIFFLPQQRRLALFDVSAARVAGLIPVDDDDVKFAAGMDKLVVGLPAKGILQRWDLATLKRELTVQPGVGTIKHIVMGHASAGPVLVHSINNPGRRPAKTDFFDLKTFKPVTFRDVGGRNDIGVDTDGYVRASADGQTFGFWRIHVSPQGVSTLVIQGNDIRRFYDHHTAGHIIPGPDGKVIYTARGRYTSECKAIDDPRTGHNYNNYLLPAIQGDYYLGIGPKDNNTYPVSVFFGTDKRPLARLNIGDGLPDATPWGREAVGVDKRLFFIPEAKVIVILPKTNDQVILQRFDIEEALEKSGVDYLLVTSTAPATVKRGEDFRYRVTARARKGGVTFKLESGPEGMRVAANGTVTWRVPTDAELKETNVIITVRDMAGQETFHTFKLKIE